ncbi:MAG: hypothetical protein ACHQ1G_08975 [Planctomycetota bacterium]
MRRAFLLFLALPGCQAAMKSALRPPALAATWIGLAADGLTWYRLDLDDEGTGACATAKGSETTLYRVRRWSDDAEVTVHLELVDGAPDAARRLELRGRSETSRLDLVVSGLHSVTLWREQDLLAARQRLAGRMGHSATTANPP